MARRNRGHTPGSIRFKLVSAAVASCFASGAVYSNPTGPNVVHGTAAIHQAGNILQITNSPNAIINWQSFSIAPNEITRFLQQSPSSAVLNRVITQDPSSILGALQSNGRVFLINPNGILFGAGAQIDVGGLVASTLNLSNEDFLAGRMRFTDGLGNSVINQGSIFTPPGGSVYLVGPAVRNEGLITSPQGEVILAAGNSVELVNPGTPNLRVEITAPDNQAMNLGQIFADSGRVGIYAGLINQSGTVQANTAVATEDGRIMLKATRAVSVTPGSITTTTGALEIEGGDITIASNVTSGPQTINATGGLTVQSAEFNSAQLVANGGQTINAQFVEVIAPSAGFASISNNGSGDQIIATTGMNAAGEGLVVRSEGSALIQQNAAGQQQVINVANADRLTLDGSAGFAGIFASSSDQTVSVTGGGANAIVIGSPGSRGISNVNGMSQHVTAGLPGQSGSISITGSAGNNQFSGIRIQPGPGEHAQVVTTTGTLSITGGSASSGISSGIFGAGRQEVSAGGITLQGGSSGSGNIAQINSGTADQRISVGLGGIGLQGGLGGTNNGVFVFGATQNISTTGNVTLTGGDGSGNSAILGGPNNVATNLVLSAGGDVVLTGGSAATTGANIGSSGPAPLQPTDIAINAGGNVILNSGAGTGARIGSSINAPAAEGDISISAGESIQLNAAAAQAARIRTLGNVTLNAGGMISEGPNGFIEAGGLTTISGAGTNLAGPNQVAAFNALNTATGNITLNNTSPLLTVTGISQVPSGSLALTQAGNLLFTGDVSSGVQGISATGDVTVAGVSLLSAGPQVATAGGNLLLQGGTTPGGSARLVSSGPVSIAVGGNLLLEGGADHARAEILGSSVNVAAGQDVRLAGGGGEKAEARLTGDSGINLTIGGDLRLSTGTGDAAWARVQTGSKDAVINVYFPNLSSGGYFVNNIEGQTMHGQTGFFAGHVPAKLDEKLIVEYGN